MAPGRAADASQDSACCRADGWLANSCAVIEIINNEHLYIPNCTYLLPKCLNLVGLLKLALRLKWFDQLKENLKMLVLQEQNIGLNYQNVHLLSEITVPATTKMLFQMLFMG